VSVQLCPGFPNYSCAEKVPPSGFIDDFFIGAANFQDLFGPPLPNSGPSLSSTEGSTIEPLENSTRNMAILLESALERSISAISKL
jgi:hypothetical protein